MTDDRLLMRTRTHVDLPKPWGVTLHNDDFTPMDFVVQVLTALFHRSMDEAFSLMMDVHENGLATIGPYSGDVAETLAIRVTNVARQNGHPLRITADRM